LTVGTYVNPRWETAGVDPGNPRDEEADAVTDIERIWLALMLSFSGLAGMWDEF
jgi:hypothetical protein